MVPGTRHLGVERFRRRHWRGAFFGLLWVFCPGLRLEVEGSGLLPAFLIGIWGGAVAILDLGHPRFLLRAVGGRGGAR